MYSFPRGHDPVYLDWLSDAMVAHHPPPSGSVFSPCGAGPWAPGNRVTAERAYRARAPLCVVCWDRFGPLYDDEWSFYL